MADASQEKVLDELSRGTHMLSGLCPKGDPNKIFTHRDLLKGDVILSGNDLDKGDNEIRWFAHISSCSCC